MNIVSRMLRRAGRSDVPVQPLSYRVTPRLPMPQSRQTAPDAPRRGPELNGEQSPQYALREIFTPTRPQRSARRIAGRHTELLRIFRAIALDRAHVVLYGERGRGKTSLVNLVASAARSSGYMVGRHTCSFESQYEDIVRGLARDLPQSMLATPAQDGAGLEGCEAALPAGRIQPRDIVALPGRLTGRHVILIIDEFDRVQDAATRTWFADAIKLASDRGAALSFVIVGVSDSLEELLGRHPSIQRNILSVALPLLSDKEIGEILEQGGRDSGLVFPPAVSSAIVMTARGVPYVAQLLGLHAGTEALLRGASEIAGRDLTLAFQRVVDEIDPRVAAIYQTVTDGGHDRAAVNTLRLIAAGEQDRFARFTASSRSGWFKVSNGPVDEALWDSILGRGLIRPCQSIGPDTFTYAEPMMQHYILIDAALDRSATE